MLWSKYNIITINKAYSDYKHVLANILRSHFVAIATQPVHRLQIRPILHNYGAFPTTPKLHLGPCNSAGMWPRTDKQTHTHRRAWPQYISRRLRLMWNVIIIIIVLISILMTMLMVLSSWQGHCGSSPGSFDECRLSTIWLPTLRPNQPTWPVSPLVGSYHPHPPSPFISITQSESWYSFFKKNLKLTYILIHTCRLGGRRIFNAIIWKHAIKLDFCRLCMTDTSIGNSKHAVHSTISKLNHFCTCVQKYAM